MMKKLLLALALLLAPASAFAQCNGVFSAAQACGSVSGGIPGPVPFSSITPGRLKLASPLTLYVNPSSTTAASCNGVTGGVGNDTNAGTLAAPFLTPAHAVNVAQSQYDVNLSQITIQYCDNNVTATTYPQLQMTANMVGALSGGSAAAAQLIIQGNSTTPSNVVVQGNGNSAFSFVGVTSPVVVKNMQIGATLVGGATSGHGIQADAHSMVYYSNITWGFISTGWIHMVATYGSLIEQEGVESIIGGASLHWYADRVSQILTTGQTITCTGSPAFPSAFVSISNGSVFTLNSAAFSGCGSVTGPKYLADSTSSFGSGSADPNTLFPGNSNGSVTLPAFGLTGIIVGGGGPPTGASGPMTAMPTMSGDCTINLSTGAIVCPKVNGVNFGALATLGTAGTPTIASGACGAGTNGTISGSNQSGVITIGASATTTCTISFSTTITAPGACIPFPGNAAAAATGTTVARVGTPSTTNWVITGSALANTVYSYVCL